MGYFIVKWQAYSPNFWLKSAVFGAFSYLVAVEEGWKEEIFG